MNHILSFALGVLSSIIAALVINFVTEKYSYHFSFRRVLKSIMKLYWKIQHDGFKPDYIVGLDRNGSIIASILSGYLGFRTIITAGTETARNPDGSRTTSLLHANLLIPDALSGKKILIVACYVDTGSTLEKVHEYYDSLPNRPSEIRTAALFTTLSPRFKPKYFVYELGKNLKAPVDKIMRGMPWMAEGWKYALADER